MRHCADPCPTQTPTIFVLVFFLVVTLGDLEVAPVPLSLPASWP